MIYAITDGEYIKIGYTDHGGSSIKHRLGALQVGNARTLIVHALISGGVPLERRIHNALGAYHVRGEWFRLTIEVMSLVDELAEQLPVVESDLPEHPVLFKQSLLGIS